MWMWSQVWNVNTSLYLFLSLSPTLYEITVTIVTQHIGLEVTAVVDAMATHMFVFCSVNLCNTHTHTQAHLDEIHKGIVACNNNSLSEDSTALWPHIIL